MGRAVNATVYELRIGIVAGLASLTFSAVHLWFDPLLNPDGVVYLLMAQRWLDEGYGDFSAATLPMPFYSMSIAVVHSLTGLSLLTIARCLNAGLIAMLVVGLQRLTWVLGGGTRAQLSVVVLALMLP